jgi:hypothetical protein
LLLRITDASDVDAVNDAAQTQPRRIRHVVNLISHSFHSNTPRVPVTCLKINVGPSAGRPTGIHSPTYSTRLILPENHEDASYSAQKS